MLIQMMSAMMERLGPSTVHVLKPIRPWRARGLARDVYKAMRKEFFVAAPFVLHSPVPELLAASWVVIRETLFTGEANRGKKEIVAWSVSEANQCPFCIGAHHAAVRATRSTDDAIRAWAEATARSGSPELGAPPFADHHVEFFGTVVGFHYLNRMVSAFLDDKMMPTPDVMDGAANSMAAIMMGGMVRKQKTLDRGGSLTLLPDYDRSLAWRPAWAEPVPSIADALEGWSGTIETVARQRLDGDLLDKLAAVIDGWEGQAPTLGEEWLRQARPAVSADDEPVADLALLTVMAPYRLDDDRIKAVLGRQLDQEQTLALVAWASQRASRRVGSWVAEAATATV